MLLFLSQLLKFESAPLLSCCFLGGKQIATHVQNASSIGSFKNIIPPFLFLIVLCFFCGLNFSQYYCMVLFRCPCRTIMLTILFLQSRLYLTFSLVYCWIVFTLTFLSQVLQSQQHIYISWSQTLLNWDNWRNKILQTKKLHMSRTIDLYCIIIEINGWDHQCSRKFGCARDLHSLLSTKCKTSNHNKLIGNRKSH